ncbi:hypothetical protein [Virgibacillus litoralis]|uniref:Uncharacterized protein n=1 Tax=Virgibacillus litoralis TaxID=578221 RepID=A0ABS4HGZ2_9BACI|nr:hypothetical protein [Virgibacillus litoralis]MBP1950195.1 hypothetical protein [Virgibacillus litoralis]
MIWIYFLVAPVALIVLIAFIFDKKYNVKEVQKVDERRMDRIWAIADKSNLS